MARALIPGMMFKLGGKLTWEGLFKFFSSKSSTGVTATLVSWIHKLHYT